jgi:hypothetical protein
VAKSRKTYDESVGRNNNTEESSLSAKSSSFSSANLLALNPVSLGRAATPSLPFIARRLFFLTANNSP